MIKALLIFLVIISWYIAGVVHSMPIMIYSICLTLFMAGMYIITRIYRKKVSFSYESEYKSIISKTDSMININIANNSGMPVARMRLDIRIMYGFYGNTTKYVVKQHLYGNCRNSKGKLQFLVNMPYSGPACIYMDRVYLYDYTGAFRTRLRINKHMNIAVLPDVTGNEMDIDVVYAGGDDNDRRELYINKRGSSTDDIRQIREYQTGDSYRHIHWNMSARMGSLLVKEYSEETDVTINVVAKVIPEDMNDYAVMGHFYDRLVSLTMAYIGDDNNVNIIWYDHECDMFMTHPVGNRQDCEDVLYELYTYHEKCRMQNKYDTLENVPEYDDSNNGCFVVVDTKN